MTTSIVRADLGYYLLPTTFYYVPLGRVDLPFGELLLLVDGDVAWSGLGLGMGLGMGLGLGLALEVRVRAKVRATVRAIATVGVGVGLGVRCASAMKERLRPSSSSRAWLGPESQA